MQFHAYINVLLTSRKSHMRGSQHTCVAVRDPRLFSASKMVYFPRAAALSIPYVTVLVQFSLFYFHANRRRRVGIKYFLNVNSSEGIWSNAFLFVEEFNAYTLSISWRYCCIKLEQRIIGYIFSIFPILLSLDIDIWKYLVQKKNRRKF